MGHWTWEKFVLSLDLLSSSFNGFIIFGSALNVGWIRVKLGQLIWWGRETDPWCAQVGPIVLGCI